MPLSKQGSVLNVFRTQPMLRKTLLHIQTNKHAVDVIRRKLMLGIKLHERLLQMHHE